MPKSTLEFQPMPCVPMRSRPFPTAPGRALVLPCLAALVLALAACGGGRDGTPVAIGSGTTTISGSASTSSSISGSSTALGTAVTDATQLLVLKIPVAIATLLPLIPALPTATLDSAPGLLLSLADACPAGGSYAATLDGAALSPGAPFSPTSGSFRTTFSACNTGAQLIEGTVADVAMAADGVMVSRLTLSGYQSTFDGVAHAASGTYRYSRDTTAAGRELTVTPDAGAALAGTPFAAGIVFVSGSFLEADSGLYFDRLSYRLSGTEYVALGAWERASAGQPLSGTVVVSDASGAVKGYLRMASGVLHVEAP